MSLPIESPVYLEGRCRACGWRVTVDRRNGFHTRAGRSCGPVETEHPFAVPDEPPLVDLDAPPGPDGAAAAPG